MSTQIRVLHLSTHDEECGIATFQKNITDAMGGKHAVHNVFFDVSPNKLKLMQGAEFELAVQALAIQLKDFDILHIQHEYSFYNGTQLQAIVDTAERLHKKVLFTLHTPPHARSEHHLVAPRGLNPRSWIHALRLKRAKDAFIRTHIQPMLKADRLIVLSQASLDSFAEYGVPRERMRIIEHLIPAIDSGVSSHLISDKLTKRSGDIILSTVGFISESKGIEHAIKALKLLPDNYKLAVIGGVHPAGPQKYLDEVTDIILRLDLQKRVYITGYIDNDEERDALIRETDACVYPYDRHYYDYVSSGALANAVANNVPVIAYRTRTFDEINTIRPFITLCKSPNYYELARSIQDLDPEHSIAMEKEYADMFTVEKQAQRFTENYLELVA